MNLITLLLPVGLVTFGLASWLGIYGTYLRDEPRSAETLRFTKQIGLVSVVLPTASVSLLVVLDQGLGPLAVLTALLTGLTLSGAVSTARFPPSPGDLLRSS